MLPALRGMVKKNAYGVYFIFKSMEQGRTFRISVPKYPTQDPNHRILAHQTSRFTHYYFYVRDEVLGPIVVRMASFFPFHATYYLNGHSFMEDVAELQAAADRLSPQIIRKQLDYRTLILGPKFSKKERSQMSLSRFYSISQIEYCRNFIFKRHFPIHKIFERGCEIGLWRLTAHRISEIFGVRLDKRLKGKLATVIDQIEHGHHVFRAYWKHAFLRQYEKFSCCRRLLCPSPPARFAIPASKSMTPGPSVFSKSCCITAALSAAGRPNRFTRPSSLRSSCHRNRTERDGRRYAYRLSAKGVDVALLLLFFHKRLCGPLAQHQAGGRLSQGRQGH